MIIVVVTTVLLECLLTLCMSEVSCDPSGSNYSTTRVSTYSLYVRGELQQSWGGGGSQSLCPSDWRVQADVGHRTAL